jgi:hypothetical protein
VGEPPSQHVAALLARIEDAMGQASGVSPVLSGNVSQTQTAASLYSLAMSAAQQIINPVKDGLNYVFAGTGRMIFDYVRAYENFDDDELALYVDSKRTVIRAEDIPDYMDIEVTFDPDMPTDKMALYNVAMQAHSSGWLPLEDTYELARLEDINEIMTHWEAGRKPGAPRAAQQPGIPSSALPPNVMQGYPPGSAEPPDAQQSALNAVMNAGRGVRGKQ